MPSASQEENAVQQPTVNGSAAQALAIGSTISFTAVGAMAIFNPPVMQMNLLHPTLRSLLACSPIISSMFIQIPMTLAVERNGGRLPVLALLGGSVVGMTTLTFVSAMNDITLQSKFNLQYLLLLTSGSLIGLGNGSYALIINAIQWTGTEKGRNMVPSAYGAITDLAGVLSPIAVYFLRPYLVPFAIYSGLVVTSLAAAYMWVVPTPYHQFRKTHAHEEALRLAVAAGQLESNIHEHVSESVTTIALNHLKALTTLRGVSLNLAFFLSLGAYFVTATILPTLLKEGYELSEAKAILAASLANLVTIGMRLPTAAIIQRFDRASGGVHVHGISSAVSALSAAPLAFYSNLPQGPLLASLLVQNATWGVSMSTPIFINFNWANPENQLLARYNPSIMLALLGAIGTAGGLVLPLTMGLMVDAEGRRGYKHYFGLVMGLALLSGLLMYLAHLSVKNTTGASLFGRAANFFKRCSPCARVEEIPAPPITPTL